MRGEQQDGARVRGSCGRWVMGCGLGCPCSRYSWYRWWIGEIAMRKDSGTGRGYGMVTERSPSGRGARRSASEQARCGVCGGTMRGVARPIQWLATRALACCLRLHRGSLAFSRK